LYNRSSIFDITLNANPFLRYSFNNALVAGMINLGYSVNYTNPNNNKKQHSFKWNLEESGLLLGRFGLFKNYLRQFIKTDFEYTYSRNYTKSAFVTHFAARVGIPISKSDTTLPFFKQYFGGGSNSMRGWPVRGIGRGSQPLAAYDNNSFNDRTGDIQLEGNFEYRYDIAQLIPNTLTLRGALFADIGNVWNMKNSKPSGTDSAQFKFRNMYRDLGISAGTGFRLDFNYFILRFDFGFRFKRPEDAYHNNGWKVPAMSFNDFYKKIFYKGTNDEYRKWRYENFNLTIGIGYSFN
jgi:outer membrane protein assembly factor BamA